MDASKTAIYHQPNVGRLQAMRVDAPLPGEAFAELARRWRRLDVHLSLWSLDGDCLSATTDGSRFWEALWSEGSKFRARAEALVVEAAPAPDSTNPQFSPRPLGDGPYAPDFVVRLIPVLRRKRARGFVVATFLAGSVDDEGFHRMCDDCGLDHAAVRSWAAQLKPLTGEQAGATIDLLELGVQHAQQLQQGLEEIDSLVGNLETTYEELGLIYRVSGEMGIPQRPGQLLQKIGKQILNVARASGVAFVLPEFDKPTAPSRAGVIDLESILSDRIVQVGAGAPNLKALERLDATLRGQYDVKKPHVLLNNAATHPGLDWTGDWLRHLVALPLVHNHRHLGILFAINCQDTADFNSIDIQLFRAVADRVSAFLENQRLYDDLADLLMGLLHALVSSIDAKDPYTCGHSERVAFLSRMIAQAEGLSGLECQRVYLSGLLHDVGKIGIPDAILCKPGRLTEEEFVELRRHPEIGARILSRINQIHDLIPGVLHHHERMDGRGYPRGLTGDEIPRLGRIICLADCFDAMTTSRTYRSALPLPMAIAEIRRCAGTQFDPRLAEVFLGMDLAKAMEEAHAFSHDAVELSQVGVFSEMASGWARPGDRWM